MSDAIRSYDWTASHDHMPGSPRKQIVDGTIEYPTPNYSARLKPSEPQGINPEILEMDLIEEAPTGVQPDVVDPVHVRYEDETDDEFTQVHIRDLDVLIEVVHTE